MQGRTHIELCGGLTVEWAGEQIEPPGRLGRLLFAYLVLNRGRSVRRDELVEALWSAGGAPAGSADERLSPPLSRLRKALPPGALDGRGELRLRLPDDAWVDWEVAHDELERARVALRTPDYNAALDATRAALAIADRGLLPEFESAWIDERRRDLADLRVELLEAIATAGAGLGGVDLAAAERPARAAVEAAPFRESARAVLMEILHANGNTAEALRVYADLRALLIEELGTTPGPSLVALHDRLLRADAAPASPKTAVQPAAVAPAAAAALPPAARLVERDREQGELAALLDGAAAGAGRAVLIEGPAGIGKSKLLLDTRARAEQRGLLTLLARSSELERDFPFGVVRQLFEASVSDPAARERALAGAAASAATVFGALEGDGDPSQDGSFAALHGLFWLTLNLTASQPLMLAIDDLQWCDRASLRFIAYLVRRLEGAPILVAATVRSGEPPTDAALQGDLAGDSATAIVRPGPLSEPAVAELVRERLGDDADPEFCTACHAATGGNPLLVRQLLSALEADGVKPLARHIDVVRDVGPRAISRSVLLRLARLGGDTVAVARAVAVLGESADLPAVAALACVDEQQVAEATGLLARAEMLRAEPPIGFAHPLIRDAVYRELPPGERELQHSRAAHVLADLGAPAEQVSSHLLVAPRRGDAWAARTLSEAGRSALRRGAADSAVTYLARALEEPPPDAERGDVLASLGQAETLTMAGSAGEHLAAAHALLTDPAERARAAYELGRLLIFSAPPGEAARVARAGIDELAGSDSPELADLRQRLESLELAAWFFGAELEDLAPKVERLRTAPVGPGAGAKMLAAMAAQDWAIRAGPADACSALALAALEGDLLIESEVGLNSVFCGMLLTFADRDEALAVWDRMLADAHRRGSLVGVTGVRFWRGWTLARRGELEDGEAALQTAIDDFTTWGYTSLLIWPAAFLGGLLVERGNLDGARAALERGGPLNPSQGSLHWLLAHGELMLASQRPEDAIAAADQVHARAGRAINPAYFPWRSLKARALDRLDRRDEAVALVHEELPLAEGWGAAGTVGRTLRVLGMLERADGIEHLERACELLASSPARLEHAKALAALGSALRHARRPSESREPLRQALELAARSGATPLVDHVRDELYASGARPRSDALSGVDSLTASERRVAALAKDGRTNRDIAQELFVTPKTVEVHLSNAYRKLGIRSRHGLAAALAVGTP